MNADLRRGGEEKSCAFRPKSDSIDSLGVASPKDARVSCCASVGVSSGPVMNRGSKGPAAYAVQQLRSKRIKVFVLLSSQGDAAISSTQP